nr:uncharacterized protein LOC112490749 [Ziziphus jujuba var. spinosa]
MNIIRLEEDETMIRLYEASLEGSIAILDSLFKKDRSILNKISLTGFTGTPLHILALHDHLNFTKKILSLKPQGPKLAAELDLLKRAPLHLASAEGHTDNVRASLQENKVMCLRRDRDGKIPLHYAAMRGRVEVIKLLIDSQPEQFLRSYMKEKRFYTCVFNMINWRLYRCRFNLYIGKYDGDWVKDRSGALMIMATVIPTMTFQTAVNPPGGVWQQDTNTMIYTIYGKSYCASGGDYTCIAGTAVLAYIWEEVFIYFLAFNSIAFLASLSIIFLLLSGFPVKYRPFMWLLNLAIACDLTFLARTFMEGMYMVTSLTIDHRARMIHNCLFYTWIGIIGIVILIHAIRFVFWAVKKLGRKLKRRWMAERTSGYVRHNITNAATVNAHV